MGGGILMKRQNPADEWIREMAANESWEAPKSCRDHTEQILAALSDSPDKEEHMRIVFRKRTLILAAALAALVGTTAAAAGLFQWHEKAVENFGKPTETEQDDMTTAGIAKEQQASVTDAGITITAKQTVQDKNTLYILMDIQAEEMILDGNGVFDCLNEDGTYETSCIIPKKEDAFSNVSMGFSPDTPCWSQLSNQGYYEISALKSLEQEWTEEEITIHFTEYSYYTYEDQETIPHTIRGDWSLTLPLGEDTIVETKTCEPKQPVMIAGMPVTVKRVELSPLSLLLVYDMDDVKKLQETLYAGEEDVFLEETSLYGFLYQDGSERSARIGGMSGNYDFEQREITRQIGLGSYVEPDQISAVLLGEEKVLVPLP